MEVTNLSKTGYNGMTKLRIGIIGCGAIAEGVHVPGYTNCPECEIVALADIHEGRLNNLGKKTGATTLYTDYKEMLAKERLDAVSVCTPNYLHAEQTIEAAKRGINVLCEKPMATSLEEADAMLRAVEGNNVTLMVGFTHRFMNFNIKTKELLESGAIGTPFMIRARFAHDGPYKSWNAKSDWFFDPIRAKGGALLDMGIHAIDMCRHFMGEITEVSGQTGTLVKDIKVEDSALALLRFASGVHGYIEVGWSSKDGALGFEIYGSQGTIIVDYSTPLKIWTEDNPTWQVIDNVAGGGWDTEIKHFVDCLISGKQPNTSGEDGRVALEVALAVYQANETGISIKLEA